MEWFLLALRKYAVFTGRSRRKEYWMFYLITTIFGWLLQLFDSLIGTQFESVGLLSTLYSLATIIPWISLSIRRLHDVNKSGWYLLLIFLPIIGWIWLFVLTVTNGDEGENQYGPDPKNPYNELDDIGISTNN